MLNIIQLALGLASVVFIFLGLFKTIRSLDKNDSSKTIPQATVIKSTVFVLIGLLLYTGVKTCSNMMKSDAADYEIYVIYLASAVDVVKVFGFLLFVPLLIKILAPKTVRKQDTDKL